MKPNLFIIGAMKAGTTWLHDALARHPDVFMSTPKEPSFFCHEPGEDHPANIGECSRTLPAYLALFASAENYLVRGESSTSYTRLPRNAGTAERIHAFDPNAKLIYLMRDPIERTISQYWWRVRYHGERRDPLAAVQATPTVCDVSNYALQLDPYLQLFSKAQVRAITIEELMTKQEALLRELLEWLGLDSARLPAIDSEKVNATPEVICIPRSRMLLRGLQDLKILDSLASIASVSARQAGRRLLERQIDTSRVDMRALIDWLRPRQKEETARLQELLRRSFPEWRLLYSAQASNGTHRGAPCRYDFSTTWGCSGSTIGTRPAIHIAGLSKEYVLTTHERQQYRTLRETLIDAAVLPWQKLRGCRATPTAGVATAQRTVKALDGVSLEVRPGEVVGVIGRNGAGKSTLLKIISQVTEPTSGRITVRGRLASLLEIGTGFHQELTGRENVYLSGAILGMSKRDLARQFDAIVDFAGIGDYIDMPVKRYSSGMLVRLAFAVAAHLEPDILLLDEVLAVGDAGFRAKCIRHMKNVLSSNVAVLFVSHQRSQIAEVCDRCVVLHQGRLVYSGDPESAWQQYVESLQEPTVLHPTSGCGSDGRLLELKIANREGRVTRSVAAHEPLSLTVAYELDRHVDHLALGIIFHQGNGNILSDWTTFDSGLDLPTNPGHHTVRLDIDGLPVSGGSYLIGTRLYDLRTGTALDRHYQRYPLIVHGPADQHLMSLRQRWSINRS